MAQIEQRFIDAAFNLADNQNVQQNTQSTSVEPRFLEAALALYTYDDPILVKQRRAAADELQNYANQLKLISDEATNAYKNYTEKRSAKEYQNQITDIKNRLTEILSGMADKQKQLEDLGYMSGETKQYIRQVQQYANELDKVLSENYKALQEQADFENKSGIEKWWLNTWNAIKSGASNTSQALWEAANAVVKAGESAANLFANAPELLEKAANQELKFDTPVEQKVKFTAWDKLMEQNRAVNQSVNQEFAKVQDWSNSKLQEASNMLVSALTGSMPMIIVSAMTGGAALPAYLGGAGGMAVPATSTSLLGMARDSILANIQNPSFWASALPALGSTYAEAKEKGANELVATTAAIINGYLNAAIETAGGIGAVEPVKTDTLIKVLKNVALEEGGEELLQGIIDGTVAKSFYDPERPWLSVKNQEAVISLQRGLQEAGVGAVIGAMFGGMQYGLNALGNRISSDVNAQQAPPNQLTQISAQTNMTSSNVAQPSVHTAIQAETQPAATQSTTQQFASEEALSRATDIAKKSGRNVVIVDTLNGKNGKYDPATNTIYLARDIPGDQAALFVLKHELTHSIQGTPEYQEFADYVLNSDTLFKIAATNNATVEDMINAVIAEAESDGQTLTREEAIAEIVADFVGSELFTNEQSIRQLVQQKPTIAQRILNFIRSLIAKVTGNEERTFLLNAERLYLKALRAPNTGTRYATLQELASRGSPDMQARYTELLSKYGKHPRGEMPARNIDVPLMNEQGQPVPRGVRTALESQIVTDETVDIVKQRIIEGAISYQPISDAAANNYARSEIAQKGFEQCLNEWNGIIENGTLPNKNQIVTAEHLLRLAGQRGDANTAARLIADLADVAARSGQVVQAMRMLKLLTPEGNLLLVQRAVKNLNNSKAFQKKVPKENRQKIAQLQEQITELQESSAAAERNFREAQDKLNALRKQRDAEKQKLQSAALETETTETVTQEKLDSLKDDVAKAEILYSDAMANLETIRDTRDSLIRERDSLTGRTETAQKRTAEVESRIQELNKQIEEITPAYEQAVNELNEARETRDELKKILTSLENRTQTAISRTQKIRQKILEVNERIQQAQQELNEAVEAKENARSAQQTVDSLRRTIEKLEGKYFIPEENINDILSQTTPEGLEAARNRALKAVAKQVKASVWEKILAWRYMGMLGTVRMNEVNALSNTAGYVAAVIKDAVGGVFEHVAQTVANKQGKEFERTKTLKAVLPFTAQKIRQFAAADYYAYEDVIAGGSKQNAFDIIRENRRIFKSKLLEGARNTVRFVPEKVDRTFLKANYVRALTQYLVANNINPDTATNEQLERARNYATKEAQRATFRLKTEAAIALNKLANSNKAMYVLVEGNIPFKRTTINVLKSGLEYSPVGLLDGITRGTYQLAKGDITATEFIDKISTGLTGTGIMILGMILRSLGLLTGGVSDDDEGQFEDLQGVQRYSVKVGDKYFSIDWLSPTAMPLFVGVELYDVWKENENFTLTRATEALALISEPVIEMSMLQGFRNMIEDTKYSDNEILTIGTSALSSYISQHIPTLFGQLARSLDDKQRRIYVESNGDIPVFLQKIYQTTLKKIPWANKALQPYIDEWGRIKESRSAVENFLIPGFVSEYQTSAMEQELQRLYKATNEGSVFPNVARKYITVDKKRIDLKANEYTQYAQAKGQMSYQLLTQLTSSSAYKALTDEQKVDAITKAYEYADALAKEKVSSYKLTDSEEKIREAEKAGISTAIYFAYRASVSGLKADKDKEGKPIPDTKRAKVVEVINSLNLTPEQKDFLYLEYGYAEKEIHQTPWHRQSSSSSTDWLYNFWGGVLGGN